MKNKLVALGALTLTLCFVTTSCSLVKNQTAEPTPEDTLTTEAVTEAVEKPIVPTFGGTLKLSARNPLTLNPLLNEDRSIDEILKLVFEPLYKLDTQYKPVPNLVDQYVFDAENNSITITLKPGLLFHNQEPLTSEDVQYSIDVLKEAPATVIYKSCVDNIQRTSIIDDLTLKIYLKQAYAFSRYYLDFPILPKDYSESENYDPFKPIGSGLYAFVDFTAMKAINFTVSEARKSEVYVQNIACTITRDEAVDTDTFKQNLIDLIAPAKFNWFEHS
ncbi:MAG: hypothetical protein H7X94_06030, partial [Vallitaleaceae bacterium]|nr:hypothetical protein [Vallitaleaceae bacterium]